MKVIKFVFWYIVIFFMLLYVIIVLLRCAGNITKELPKDFLPGKADYFLSNNYGGTWVIIDSIDGVYIWRKK